MKFPSFTTPSMVGLSICSHLKDPSEEIRKDLADLHKRSPFMKYGSKDNVVYTHVLGGDTSSAKHLHVDLFKASLLTVEQIAVPRIDIKKTELSNELDRYLGCNAQVEYTGLFLVNRSSLSNRLLVWPVSFGDDNSARRIQMVSASFVMAGLPVKALEWRLTADDKVLINLSFSVEVEISKDLLAAPVVQLIQSFNLLVLGERDNAGSE